MKMPEQLKDLSPCFGEALGVYEALRRLGFQPEDVTVGLFCSGERQDRHVLRAGDRVRLDCRVAVRLTNSAGAGRVERRLGKGLCLVERLFRAAGT